MSLTVLPPQRTSIGLSLITHPRVLFLDEPTSGLDSHSGTEVMRLVAWLAHSGGTTVAATIHSPTAATFALFDALLLLLHGAVAYFGPPGDVMT